MILAFLTVCTIWARELRWSERSIPRDSASLNPIVGHWAPDRCDEGTCSCDGMAGWGRGLMTYGARGMFSHRLLLASQVNRKTAKDKTPKQLFTCTKSWQQSFIDGYSFTLSNVSDSWILNNVVHRCGVEKDTAANRAKRLHLLWKGCLISLSAACRQQSSRRHLKSHAQ